MSLRKNLTPRLLVSLNTAYIKLRSHHPRIAEDLHTLFHLLKEEMLQPREARYKEDGYIDIES